MRDIDALSPEQLAAIHKNTVRILETTGIDLRHNDAAGMMKKKGFRVDGTRLYIKESQLMAAIASTPSHFTVKSPVTGSKVHIGGDDYI
ncbi:MAG: trimethylamine methyltransferase family protein, partial [Desulfobacterales bacterium]|nr:trimethylamine methyltransferase family protein [Desulfobacterales bacterium]